MCSRVAALSNTLGGASLAAPWFRVPELHAQADSSLQTNQIFPFFTLFFLFLLCSLEWVIDARQKGNKLRFANHSSSANCRAEILMVDGDHRVAIMTNREMDGGGTEITYDYNYEDTVAPEWAADCGRRRQDPGLGTPGGGRGRRRG